MPCCLRPYRILTLNCNNPQGGLRMGVYPFGKNFWGFTWSTCRYIISGTVSSAPTQPLMEVKPKHGNCNCYDLKCVAGQSKVVEQPPYPELMGEPCLCTSCLCQGCAAPAAGACLTPHHTSQPHFNWLATSHKEDTVKQNSCFIPPVKSMNWLKLRRVLQSCKRRTGRLEELVLLQSMPSPAAGCNASPQTQPSMGCVFLRLQLSFAEGPLQELVLARGCKEPWESWFVADMHT